LDDRDFDTGQPTRPTEYRLADEAYAKLARDLSKVDRTSIDPDLQRNVLEFFKNPDLPYATRKSSKDKWKETQAALEKLKSPAEPVKSPTETRP
jgi:hypothetical protein